jgi:putative ABC transport system permease protein
MTPRALAWRTITASPARAVLAVAGVAIIGALLFDMLLLSRGLLLSFRDLLESAGYDVRVVASESFPVVRLPVPRASALAAQLEGLPEVQEVAVVRTDRASVTLERSMPDQVFSPDRTPEDPPTGQRSSQDVTLVSVSSAAERRAWQVVRGHGLAEAAGGLARPPLLVSRRLAKVLDLSPGSTVMVRVVLAGAPSALPRVRFTVVGVAAFSFDLSDDFTAATTADAFRQTQAESGSDDADLVLVSSRAGFGSAAAVAAISQVRPDVKPFSNDELVSRFNENGFAYFRQISFVLSSITLGFAFLLIATLLTMSVNQRLGEVAGLRALGIPRRRIAAALLWESTWLVGGGGLIALPLGWLLATRLDHLLKQMPGLPERLHFFVLEPRAVVLHLGLFVAAGVAASAYPIWVATRLPIAATLRRDAIS